MIAEDFTGSQKLILACLAAFLIFTAMVLLYRYLRRTMPVGKTRFGFFIERDYENPVVYPDPESQVTKEWPSDK